jgi:uncharacterized glyoxalase superfamily protein PhnB/uncharacterized protein YndB with AHSA1/START domain
MTTTQASKTIVTAEPGKQEIFIKRELEAPRNLVLKAFTDPDLYKQWVGPRRLKMTIEQFEPYAGGRWRYSQIDEKGNKFAFHGVYHEVSPSLIIDTFEYEGLPEKGHAILEIVKIDDISPGRTRLSIQNIFQSISDRDGMLQTGMEQGLTESFERLDDVLEMVKKEGITRLMQLSPYLNFDGNCREAMEFYKHCLGGDLELMTVGDSPMAEQMGPKMKDKIMHSVLKKDGMVIMAADNMGKEKITEGNAVALTITSDNKSDIEDYYSRLSAGSKKVQPLEKTYFGWYGDFTDKFGIRWMFQANNPK